LDMHKQFGLRLLIKVMNIGYQVDFVMNLVVCVYIIYAY